MIHDRLLRFGILLKIAGEELIVCAGIRFAAHPAVIFLERIVVGELLRTNTTSFPP
jgi:hypothetical protein